MSWTKLDLDEASPAGDSKRLNLASSLLVHVSRHGDEWPDQHLCVTAGLLSRSPTGSSGIFLNAQEPLPVAWAQVMQAHHTWGRAGRPRPQDRDVVGTRDRVVLPYWWSWRSATVPAGGVVSTFSTDAALAAPLQQCLDPDARPLRPLSEGERLALPGERLAAVAPMCSRVIAGRSVSRQVPRPVEPSALGVLAQRQVGLPLQGTPNPRH